MCQIVKNMQRNNILVVCDDDWIIILNIIIKKLIRKLRGHNKYIINVQVSPNSKFIISGSGDNSIKMWKFESGE